ncbi:MAG: hypothetical protein IJQ76_03440, partial [Prevotella sp.]|nr:hypothetical protein [Prevotella sp.]
MDKQKEKKEIKERKENWREYWATVDDIERFLDDHILLRRNVVTGRVECRIPESDYFQHDGTTGMTTDWVPLTDHIVNELWRLLSKTKKVKKPDIYNVIESNYTPCYHPF